MSKSKSKPKTLPTWKSFIDHNPSVGTEAMEINGLPGTGKSAIVHNLVSWGLNRKNIIIMRGSKSCEWRHLLNSTKCEKITVFISNKLLPTKEEELPNGKEEPIVFKRIPPQFIPEFDEEYQVIPKTNKKLRLEFKYCNLESLNLEEHIKPRQIFVLYDHCFPTPQRTWLIVDQLVNLVQRNENEFTGEDLDEIPIIYAEHEAQVVFPMTSLSPKKQGMSNMQWHAVNYMQHLAVDFRKDLIKPIYVSQLHSQFDALVRDLCCFRVMKKGYAGGHVPEAIRKSTPWLEINECNIMVGYGAYLQKVKIDKFPETEKKWKMIPRKMINYKCKAERLLKEKDKGNHVQEQRDKAIRMLLDKGVTQSYIGEELGITHQRVSQIGALE